MRILLALVVMSTAAMAQTAAPNFDMQALQAKVFNEMNAHISCLATGIAMEQELVKLRAEVAELKKKAEGK